MTNRLTFEWQKDGTCIVYVNGKVNQAGLTQEQLYAPAPGLESLAAQLNYDIEIKRVEE